MKYFSCPSPSPSNSLHDRVIIHKDQKSIEAANFLKSQLNAVRYLLSPSELFFFFE